MITQADFEKLREIADKQDCAAIDRGNGHWQLKGVLTVNFYPSTRTVYINGTTEGFSLSHDGDPLVHLVMYATGKLSREIEKKEHRKRAEYKKFRRRMLEKDPHCSCCRKELTMQTATVDHRVPLDKGGSNRPDNLVLVCGDCNRDKGNQLTVLQKLHNG